VTNDFGYNVRSEMASAAMVTNTYGYAFDPIGNRLVAANNATVLSYQANSLNQYTNILEGAAPSAPLYDLDGSMTVTGDGWRYEWNGENRLVKASNDKTVVAYAYDHQGRMVWKQVATNAEGLGTEKQKHLERRKDICRRQIQYLGWHILCGDAGSDVYDQVAWP
jgi:YD repeat-containing protein